MSIDEPLPHDADAARGPGAAQFRARSRLVHRARRWMPMAMGGVVLLVAGWIAVSSLLSAVTAERASAGSIHMIKPKFYGRDADGRAFRLEAASAVRDAKTPDVATMTAPALALDPGQGKPMTANAPIGVYQQTPQLLALTGGVVVDDGKGGVFHSAAADVNVGKGEVHGRDRVSGVTPLGNLTAAAYSIDGKGDHAVFTGGVRAHLNTRP